MDVLAIGPATPAATGDVAFVDADGFTVGEAASVAGVTARWGNVNLATSDGDLTIGNSTAVADISTPFTVTLAAWGQDDLVAVAPGVRIVSTTSGGFNVLRADKMRLEGTIEAPDGVVALLPQNFGKAIQLGSTNDTTSNTLELSDAELDRITADVLQIGSSATGNMNISAAISPAGTSVLHLTSGGEVTQSGSLAAAELAIEAQGSITLGAANALGRVALRSTAGDVYLIETDGLEVGSVDSVDGARAGGNLMFVVQAGNVLVKDTPDSADLAAVNLTIHVNANETVFETESGSAIAVSNMASVLADKMKLGGTLAGGFVDLSSRQDGQAVDLGSTSDENPNTLELSDAELSGITATSSLRVGPWSGSVVISAPISAETVNQFWIRTSGGVTQTAGIIQPWLFVEAADGDVLLDGPNDIDRVALSAASGNITFTDVDGFQTLRFDGVTAVKAPNGSVTLTALSGNVNLSAPADTLVAAGPVTIALYGDDATFTLEDYKTLRSGEYVHIVADKMVLAGSISATGQTVTLRPHAAGTTVTLGSTTDNTANTLELSDAELDRITAGTLVIGSSSSGPLTISQTIAPANASTLHLISGGAVTQTASVQVANLAVEANGAVSLGLSGNDVDVVAIGPVTTTATGDISFRDADGVAVGEVTSVAGVTARWGNVNLATVDGTLTIGNSTAAADISTPFTVTLAAWGQDDLVAVSPGARIVSTSSGGFNTLRADKMQLEGSIEVARRRGPLLPQNFGQAIQLGPTSDTTAHTLELSDAELDGITASTLRIGDSVAGPISISALIEPINTATLHLVSGGAVTETVLGLNVDNLAIEAGGAVTLNYNNFVGTLAIHAPTAKAEFRNNGNLAVGEVDGVAGIVVGNGQTRLNIFDGGLTIRDTTAMPDVDSQGEMTFYLPTPDAQLTVDSGAQIQTRGTGASTLVADRMAWQGTMDSGAAAVQLQPAAGEPRRSTWARRPMELSTRSSCPTPNWTGSRRARCGSAAVRRVRLPSAKRSLRPIPVRCT